MTKIEITHAAEIRDEIIARHAQESASEGSPSESRGPSKVVDAAATGSQSGFWRSPTGENHGRDSRPGDVWCDPGAIHDTDRLDALLSLDIDVKSAEDGGWLLVDWRANPPRTTEHKTGRDAVDAALLANTELSGAKRPPQ